MSSACTLHGKLDACTSRFAPSILCRCRSAPGTWVLGCFSRTGVVPDARKG